MIEKTLWALSNTLSIKRDHLFEIYKTIESRIPFKKKYNKIMFQELISKLLKELTLVLEEWSQQITHVVKNLKEEKMSKYFEIGSLFLGKYKITGITSYRANCKQKQGSMTFLSQTNTNQNFGGLDNKEASSQKSITSDDQSESHDLEEDKNSTDYKYAISNKENMLNHLHVYNLEYSYRIKTVDMFDINEKQKSFDIFILDDWKFEEYFLFSNIWRETLLLHTMSDDQVLEVTDFGQLPGDIIFRETEDFHLYTLEDYLQEMFDQRENEDSINEAKINEDTISEDEKIDVENETIFQRKSTFMKEYTAIEIIMKVINLIEILHSKSIIHTNINPGEIFFRTVGDLDTLWFNSLYHWSWDAKKILRK